MALMTWDESFSVGVADLDEQHKKLVGMLNSLNDAMMTGKSKDVLQGLLTELIGYTASHFGSEEKLFAKYEYLETSMHMYEHKKFVQKVLEFEKGFKEGKLMLSIEVRDFLRDWLVKHIMGTDKKYGPFLNSKGVK
jgi:hemerythrin